MHFMKMVPVVGLCAAIFMPTYARADSHITQFQNAGSKLCLDATDKRDSAFVQQSKCDTSLEGQVWEKVDKGPGLFWLQNKWTGTCLDIYVADQFGIYPMLNTVTTSQCEDWKEAQKWIFIGNGMLRNSYTHQCIAAPGQLKPGPVKAVECSLRPTPYLHWQENKIAAGE
jgi:hypothetical protein